MIEKIPQLSVDFTTGRTQSKANNILFQTEYLRERECRIKVILEAIARTAKGSVVLNQIRKSNLGILLLLFLLYLEKRGAHGHIAI